jgi:hypothetical protein
MFSASPVMKSRYGNFSRTIAAHSGSRRAGGVVTRARNLSTRMRQREREFYEQRAVVTAFGGSCCGVLAAA